jgi:hypothetical protein
MTTLLNKNYLACALLACCFLNSPAMASGGLGMNRSGEPLPMPEKSAPDMSVCTKKMLVNPRLASKECLFAQLGDLEIKVDKRYAEINSSLPEKYDPADDNTNPNAIADHDTLSKTAMHQVYSDWRIYQHKACYAYSRKNSLQSRDGNEYSICMLGEYKQHLNFLKRF